MRFVKETALPFEGNECLEWPYSGNNWGYGQLTVAGRLVVASRFVCEIAHGDPPTPEYQAAHSCGNGHLGCVNPQHLRWATPKENSADKIRNTAAG